MAKRTTVAELKKEFEEFRTSASNDITAMVEAINANSNRLNGIDIAAFVAFARMMRDDSIPEDITPEEVGEIQERMIKTADVVTPAVKEHNQGTEEQDES